jgi:hypothetical protein
MGLLDFIYPVEYKMIALYTIQYKIWRTALAHAVVWGESANLRIYRCLKKRKVTNKQDLLKILQASQDKVS